MIEQYLTSISAFIWGLPLLILLGFTHVYLTLRLRFIQRFTFRAVKLSLARSTEGHGDISHFGALTTALAATIGTGNIIGVGTAVAMGGPGAVLWMWLTGVFGIATKYSEALLSIKYRVSTRNGQMAGGPMYVLERGLKSRPLAIAFAGFTAIAAFGIGNTVQANSISDLLLENFGLSRWISGIFLTVITGVVILGGIRSISRVCEKLVPFMAVFYIVGCLWLLVVNAARLPDTFWLIITSAFSGQAAMGAFVGATVQQALRAGMSRGLFSNESGLGSAPIVAAAAQTKNPVRQALVSSTGTFWDTVVVCLLTGLVLVNSGQWTTETNGALLTNHAFREVSAIGPTVLTVSLFTFVLSTILGWSYYGEKAVEYLFGEAAIRPYRYLWVAAVLVGSLAEMPAVWAFADIANALMALPNLLSLLLLTRVVVQETDRYLWSGSLDDADE